MIRMAIDSAISGVLLQTFVSMDVEGSEESCNRFALLLVSRRSIFDILLHA